MVSEQEVLAALSRVKDPELGRDLVSLGMIKDLRVDGSRVSFTLELTTPACPLSGQIEGEARRVVASLPGVRDVELKVTAQVRSQPARQALPAVKHTIAIGSGKGGVGKSTVAVNLAVALAEMGAATGLLDADIYGPSIPVLMGIRDQPRSDGQKIIPLEHYKVKLMSLGFLLPEGAPVIWRGPMVAQAVRQLLQDVAWGGLDYLLIDLPPGTGDAQLTLCQTIPLTGAVIVMTPQDVATAIGSKTLNMFRQLKVPILGIIENMSYFVCPHCGESTEIFDRGGGKRASEVLGVPFLGEIPLDPEIRLAGDEGCPLPIRNPASPVTEIYSRVARALAGRVSVETLGAIPQGSSEQVSASNL